MKYPRSRRLFLNKTSLALTGLTLLPINSFLSATNHLEHLGADVPSSVVIVDMRKKLQAKKQVLIQGKIYNNSNQKGLEHSKIEVWHRCSKTNKFSYKTELTTDETGRYHFITDYPGKEEGRASRVYFKISKDGKETTTELLLTNSDVHITGSHYEKNYQLGEKTFPTLEKKDQLFKVDFNILLK